jgi:uncharacterized protein (TIGR00299 family) protein
MARVMYFDAFMGAAGDMILAALIDAGLPVEALRAALGSLGVDHDLRVTRVLRAGVSATHVHVGSREQATAHDHAHEHGHTHDEPASHHGHHTLEEIGRQIERSSLSAAGKARATAMFRRLAEAEAAIHGVTIEKVHLHEVGAVDSIIDIAGTVFAFEWWGIDDVVASPLNVGAGTVRIAHGTFPVPAPATLRLLAGTPVVSRGPEVELLTPTGALVLTTYAHAFGPMPPMTVERIGYGAGTRDVAEFPNVLRVVIGERPAAEAGAGPAAAQMVRIESAIDDMAPQLFGPLIDRLLAAGAVDAFLTPVLMKKGRPGTLVTALAPEVRRAAVCDALFRETTTLGVRFDAVERETLDREWVDVTVGGGQVRIKVAGRRGEVLNAAPEFEDCLRVAEATGRPVKAVRADAMRAWFATARGSNG